MKIRTGFVSNSSSSSFVLIGTKIEKSDIGAKIENKRDFESIYFLGRYLNEGQDVFRPTIKQVEAIVEREIEGEFFDAFFLDGCSDDIQVIEAKKIKEAAEKNIDLHVIHGDADQHSSYIGEYFTFNDFIERYEEDD